MLFCIEFRIFVYHFHISYSNVNEISYFKDAANLYQKGLLNCTLKMALKEAEKYC